MRRNVRDEILRSLLLFNSALRQEVRDIRRLLAARQTEAKYNPNWRRQPRAPRGTTEGGRWIGDKVRGGAPKQAPQSLPADAPGPGRVPPQQSVPLQNFGTPNAANDNDRFVRIPLAATRLSVFTLPSLLSGDTPRPERSTRIVPGTDDLLLVIDAYPQAASRRFIGETQRGPQEQRYCALR